MYDVWISRSSSMLSMVGSSAIIYIIISARRRKLLKPKNRFMLMMSVFDVLQSAALIVSTAALPNDKDIYGAMGNNATCTAQSIFMGLGLAVPLYNSSLNLFYLLTILYNMNSTRFSTKIEPFLHVFSVLGPLSSVIIFAALGYSEPVDSKACLYPGKTPRLGFFVLVVFSFLFCIYSMGSICWSVISQENRVRSHRFASSQTNRVTILEVDETIKQALLYSLAFLLTFLFPMIHALIRLRNPDSTVPTLSILSSIFDPLQGFYNFIFYVRPGINHVREIDSSKSFIGALKEVIFNAGIVSSSRNNPSRSMPQLSNCSSSHSPIQIISDTCIVESMGKSPSQSLVKGTGEVLLNIEELSTTSLPNAVDVTTLVIDEENEPNIKQQSSSRPMGRRGLFTVNDEESRHTITDQHLLRLVGRRASIFSLASIKSAISVDSVSEEGNEDNSHNIKNQPSHRQVGKRASLVSLASIMSDISFDSLSEGSNAHINEPG